MKKIFLIALLALSHLAAIAQKGEVRGIVYEKETGVPIDFAPLVLKEIQKGTYSDDNGFYNITPVPPGTYTLFCYVLGYDSVSVNVTVTAGKVSTHNLFLTKSSYELGTVEVSAEKQDKQTNTQIAKTKITSKELTKLATVGGEPDLIQTLQILPGVSTSGDQGGQLYIRGGSPVMNKVLLDGMTIYQPFHSIGLFSVFDADIIRSADVYTAGFNAEYGGRISGVVDVTTREGNKTRFGGKIAANPFTSKILLEGPLKKYREGGGSSSFVFSYKNSYLKQTSKLFYPYLDENRLPYSFGDLYGKLSFVGSNGSKFEMFGFNQQDNVDFAAATKYGWKSSGFGSKFVVLPDESKTKIDGHFAYSNYDMKQQDVGAKPRESSISSVNIGLNFEYLMGRDQFIYGTEINTFRTSLITYNANDRIINQTDNNTELSIFSKYKMVRNRWVVEPGIRMQYYASFSEFFFEPRLSAKYNVNKDFRFKAAGGLYSQNITSAVSDRDVVNLFYGFLAGPDNLPSSFEGHAVTSRLQKARHGVAGFEWDITKELDIIVETYYKDFYQLTNINRDKIYDDTPENQDKPEIYRKDYIVERGNSYGFDVRARYENKRFYLWLVYSLNYVNRFDGVRNYAPHFDRRHNANIVASYLFGKKNTWELNTRWNFGSGFPFTQTQGFYENLSFNNGISTDYTSDNGQIGVLYGDLNAGRLPSFHRLDISLQKSFLLSKNSKLNVIFSCINVYNRANIFYVDRITNKRVDQLPFLPSLGANLTF